MFKNTTAPHHVRQTSPTFAAVDPPQQGRTERTKRPGLVRRNTDRARACLLDEAIAPRRDRDDFAACIWMRNPRLSSGGPPATHYRRRELKHQLASEDRIALLGRLLRDGLRAKAHSLIDATKNAILKLDNRFAAKPSRTR